MVSNASSASLGKLPRLIARRRRRGASGRTLALLFVRGAALAWIYGANTNQVESASILHTLATQGQVNLGYVTDGDCLGVAHNRRFV